MELYTKELRGHECQRHENRGTTGTEGQGAAWFFSFKTPQISVPSYSSSRSWPCLAPTHFRNINNQKFDKHGNKCRLHKQTQRIVSFWLEIISKCQILFYHTTPTPPFALFQNIPPTNKLICIYTHNFRKFMYQCTLHTTRLTHFQSPPPKEKKINCL